jgi:hypothetical protein
MRLALLFLAACADDEVVCGDNTTLTDGVCVAEPAPEPEPPTFEAVLDQLYPCTSTEGDGRIDLAEGCVDEVCVGSRTPADADCSQPIPDFPEYWVCTWQPGVFSTWFGDVDPRRGLAVDEIIVERPYQGKTTDGLGVGTETGCFIQALGDPTSFRVTETKRGWGITEASWPRIWVYDDYGDPDGIIDQLVFFRQSGGS